MDLTFYGEDNKGVIKLDPRTKIIILLAGSLTSLNSYSMTGMIVCSLLICLLIALCGKSWTGLKAALLFGVVLYFHFMLGNSEGASPVIVGILNVIMIIFSFGFPTVAAFILIIKTTRISHFLSAFQAMHVPVKVIVPFAVFFRFLPTVTDEWNGIRKAMAFRGISLSPVQVLTHPLRTIEYILIPMLFSTISVMEELAAAAMARGMDIETKRSSYGEVKLTLIDYIVGLIFIGIIAFSLYTGYRILNGGSV